MLLLATSSMLYEHSPRITMLYIAVGETYHCHYSNYRIINLLDVRPHHRERWPMSRKPWFVVLIYLIASKIKYLVAWYVCCKFELTAMLEFVSITRKRLQLWLFYCTTASNKSAPPFEPPTIHTPHPIPSQPPQSFVCPLSCNPNLCACVIRE